jgi:RhtB (resistance to homoserine/threonine) family protein
MTIDSQVVTFTLVAAALTLTPGADTLLVVRNVLRGGRRDGFFTTFGICLGLFVHATLSALGLSVILVHSAAAFHVIKYAGAAYLAWLGLQSLAGALRSPSPAGHGADPTPAAAPVPARRCFLEGFLNNVLNPKVAVFYLAFLPQFIAPGDAVLQKSLLLAGIHYAQGIVWLATVSVLVDQSRRFFLRSAIRRWLDGVCGTLLIALGVRLALERQ